MVQHRPALPPKKRNEKRANVRHIIKTICSHQPHKKLAECSFLPKYINH